MKLYDYKIKFRLPTSVPIFDFKSSLLNDNLRVYYKGKGNKFCYEYQL